MQWAGVLLAASVLFLSSPWEAKAPREWSELQLRRIFTDSPWAQSAESGMKSKHGGVVPMYLATALPMREAEAELRRRTKPGDDVLFEEYRAWLAENASTHLVVAVRLPRPELLVDAEESRLLERESKLIAGGRRHAVQVMFSPTRTDPWLRLAFPRAVRHTDKQFEVEIYVPAAAGNYRVAVFALRDLIWRGKPEY